MTPTQLQTAADNPRVERLGGGSAEEHRALQQHQQQQQQPSSLIPTPGPPVPPPPSAGWSSTVNPPPKVRSAAGTGNLKGVAAPTVDAERSGPSRALPPDQQPPKSASSLVIPQDGGLSSHQAYQRALHQNNQNVIRPATAPLPLQLPPSAPASVLNNLENKPQSSYASIPPHGYPSGPLSSQRVPFQSTSQFPSTNDTPYPYSQPAFHQAPALQPQYPSPSSAPTRPSSTSATLPPPNPPGYVQQRYRPQPQLYTYQQLPPPAQTQSGQPDSMAAYAQALVQGRARERMKMLQETLSPQAQNPSLLAQPSQDHHLYQQQPQRPPPSARAPARQTSGLVPETTGISGLPMKRVDSTWKSDIGKLAELNLGNDSQRPVSSFFLSQFS